MYGKYIRYINCTPSPQTTEAMTQNTIFMLDP
jgi:hypothetical protein